MRLRWTTPAAQDLYNIVRRIQQDNVDAATKVAKTLFRVQDQDLELLRIYHGAQDWP